MLGFCLKAWVYLAAVCALAAALRLVKDWKKAAEMDKWCTAAFIAFALHALEENALPGGAWYLANSGNPAYPLNSVSNMLSGLILLVAAAVALLYGIRKISAIAFMVFCLVEGVRHCVVLVRASLMLSGVFYNPGFVTALIFFLPLAMVLLVRIIESKPQTYELVAGAVVTALALYLVYFMPGQVLGDPASPYAFSDPGFYSFLS